MAVQGLGRARDSGDGLRVLYIYSAEEISSEGALAEEVGTSTSRRRIRPSKRRADKA